MWLYCCSTCKIVYSGHQDPKLVCLATGKGALPCDALGKALESLFEKICDNCFVIEVGN